MGIAIADLLLGLLVGVLVARAKYGRRRVGDLGPAPTPLREPPAVEPDQGAASKRGSDREVLVDALIEARDTMNPQLVHAQQIGLALESVGVHTFDPTGERFNPTRHNQVDTALTDDRTRDGLVSEVQAFGYEEGRELRRFAQVVVWRYKSGAAGE